MTLFYGINSSVFVAGYIEAMLWAESGIDPSGEERESLEGYDLSEGWLHTVKEDCQKFLTLHGDKINLAIAGTDDYDHTQAGRDFWLTRQGHGVGFWDRGLGLVGDDLSAAARSFGEKHVFIDDDGLIGGRMMNIDMLVDFILSHGYGEPTPEGLKLGLDLMAKGDDYSTAAAEVVAHGLTVEAE